MQIENSKRPKKSAIEPRALTLVELQKFLVDELAESSPSSTFQRAFQPLTDGLGLESPPERQKPPSPARRSVIDQLLKDPFQSNLPLVEVKPPPPVRAPLTPLDLLTDDELGKMRTAREVLEPEIKSEPEPLAPLTEFSNSPDPTPPPIPAPSQARRMMAALLDHFFVGFLTIIACLITAQLTAKGDFSILKSIEVLGKPPFPFYAMVEYLALWFCYLFVGLGLLENTFGMWVWGIKVRGDSSISRLRRIFFTTLFIPTLFPSIFLVFKKKGKNLIDLLSGTTLYLSPA